MRHIESTLYGQIQGPIWMPVVVCTKPVKVNLTSERARYNGKPTLEFLFDMRVLNDGDFQWTRLSDDSYIEVTLTKKVGRSTVTRSRIWPIMAFKSLAGCVEPTVYPEYSEEE